MATFVNRFSRRNGRPADLPTGGQRCPAAIRGSGLIAERGREILSGLPARRTASRGKIAEARVMPRASVLGPVRAEQVFDLDEPVSRDVYFCVFISGTYEFCKFFLTKLTEGAKVSELIGILTFFFGVSFTVYTLYSQNRDQKRRLALHMHTLWNSPPVKQARWLAFETIAKKIEASEGKRVPEASFDPELQHAVGDVRHFFADLNHLVREKAVDAGLIERLFSSTAISWFERVLSRVDYDESELGKRRKEFYQNEVLPLYGHFQNRARRN